MKNFSSRGWDGPVNPCARRTRTIKQCSSDARSQGQPGHSSGERREELGDARSASALREKRLESLLCSRNARPQKALVGRAHGRTRQATFLMLEGEDERNVWWTAIHRHRPVDDENVECPCFFVNKRHLETIWGGFPCLTRDEKFSNAMNMLY